MLLYVAVGLIPLAVLSTYAGPQLDKEYHRQLMDQEEAARTMRSGAEARAERDLRNLLRIELSREFTEFQHWRAPLNVQSQAPSVVRSPIADRPTDPLVKFYFQLRSDGGPIRYTTPHFPEQGQAELESYQTQAPLSSSFEQTVRAGLKSFGEELPWILSTPIEKAQVNLAQGDVATQFHQARSGDKPDKVQLVSNELLVVNANAQEVANKARSAQVEKKQSRKENTDDPWRDLRRPPGVDDLYGDSLVRIYPYCVYTRSGEQPTMVFWRTVRTPSEQIMQGFVVDVEFGQGDWARERFGENYVPGFLSAAAQRTNYPVGTIWNESGDGELWLQLALPGPRVELPDRSALSDRLDQTRKTYALVGAGYLLLLLAFAFALHRTVSRSEALAQQQGEFVAAVSHELRTPLTAMRLFTELLIGQAKSAKNEKVEQHASRILDEEERLTRLVEMILLAAQIERGSFKVEIAEAPLGETLGAAIEAALRAHAGREVINEARDLPIVKQDRAAAQQVFFNLIDNALKYSRDAGKPVSISSETKDGKLVLRIIDQGAGISDSDKPRLFQRFARGTKANEQGAGTGLGLWLTREYARQMGWEVSLESKPGEGTTASVEIPL